MAVAATGDQERRAAHAVVAVHLQRLPANDHARDLLAPRRLRVVGVGHVVGQANQAVRVRGIRLLSLVFQRVLDLLPGEGGHHIVVGKRVDVRRFFVGDIARVQVGAHAAGVHDA